MRVALLNPNTSALATERMLARARAVWGTQLRVDGRTAPRGPALIADEPSLHAAARVVCGWAPGVADEGFDALVVAGFGDPGVLPLRRCLRHAGPRGGPLPVLGLAEAAIQEAGEGGRRFAIVTITPALHASLLRSVQASGEAAGLCGIRFTEGDPLALAADTDLLAEALLQVSREAITRDGAQAIVIGGGPLAEAAHQIAPLLPVPLVEPVWAAMRRVGRLLGLDPVRHPGAQ